MALRPKNGLGLLRFSERDVLLRIPGGGGLDPETVIWIGRIESAGGHVSERSILIADALIRAIKATSYGTKVKYLIPLLGSDLTAARVPLRDSLGVGIADSFNFDDSDFSESTGLQGNGTSKYLDSLVKPSDLGTGSNGGIGFWENNPSAAGSTVVAMGCYPRNTPPGVDYWGYVLELRTAATSTFTWGASADFTAPGIARATADFYGQRSAQTSRVLYKDGVSVATNTTSSAALNITHQNIRILGGYDEGGTTYYYGGRCACAYMTDGTLTASEVAALHTLLGRKLMTPTRRPSA